MNKLFDWDSIEASIKLDYDNYLIELELFDLVCKCESPIEHLLYWEFIKQWDGFPATDNFLSVDVAKKHGDGIHGVHIQREVVLGNLTFRVDFAIDYWNSIKQNGFSLFIEVDGHEFHEKTKEAVRRDKMRDRLFAKHGHELIRFTGSEVYNSPKAVVDEIYQHIIARGKK